MLIHKKWLSMILIMLLLTTITTVYGSQKYGYEAVKPSDSFKEIIGVKGRIYSYGGSVSSDHVDRMIYLFTTKPPMLSVGLGHMEFANGAIYYTRYFDEGLDDNIHWVYTGSTPSGWYTAEVYTTSASSTVYRWKINDQSIGSWSCSDCNPIIVAGATSWGNNANYVFGNFTDLQLKRNIDTQYQDFQSVANLKKCFEEPAAILGFEYQLPGNSANQLLIDATSAHECTGDVSTQWLYRGGNWG